MADDVNVDDDPIWTVQLDKVERLFSDEPEVDDENVFAVTFKASGLDMSAEIEVEVPRLADEALVVTEALDALRDGLERWAAALALRRGAEPAVEG